MMYWYPPSKPKKVKGGIRAQGLKSRSAMSWWAGRWLDVVHGFDIGQRMSRGRSYARNGQVADLEISAGKARATVQGSRSSAYRVSVEIEAIGEREWKKIAKAIFAEPATAAGLLAGQMPKGVEKAFKSAGEDLIPRRSELVTECSCPDWSNPCKHTAAVFFLLAEEFERDPFLMFRLRGSGRDRLLKMAGPARGAKPPPSAPPAASPARGAAPEPLPSDPAKFWGEGAGRYDPGDAFVPKIHAALPKQLGSFPFWRGEEDFADAMESAYRDASEAGMAAFLGEYGERREEPRGRRTPV